MKGVQFYQVHLSSVAIPLIDVPPWMLGSGGDAFETKPCPR